MKVNVNTMGLSLTVVLTMTLLECAWSATTMFQRANQNTDADTMVGRDAFGTDAGGLLVRRARHTRNHMPPCVFLPQLIGIKRRFQQWMDKNQDGRATFAEVKTFLKSLKADVSDEAVASFIARRDQNGNGEVDLIPEYVEEIVGNDYGDKAAQEWFYLHDVDSDGFVTKPELVRLGMAIGMTQDQAESTAAGYYLPLDVDGDGKLNFTEFSRLYQDPSMPQ